MNLIERYKNVCIYTLPEGCYFAKIIYSGNRGHWAYGLDGETIIIYPTSLRSYIYNYFDPRMDSYTTPMIEAHFNEDNFRENKQKVLILDTKAINYKPYGWDLFIKRRDKKLNGN